MIAIRSIVSDAHPAAYKLLADMHLAPRQFVERFLDQEDVVELSLDDLAAMDLGELNALLQRWRTVGVSPVHRPEAAVIAERPEFLDGRSADEMMRGYFFE